MKKNLTQKPGLKRQPKTPSLAKLKRPQVLVFDVNETLLDIEFLAPFFQRVFGDERVLREWFGQLVMYSMTLTISGLYSDYFTLGQGVLKMLARIYDVPLKKSDADEIRTRMATLPAHPDVADGLQLLRKSGFRLATLTNSPRHKSNKSALDNAGLSSFFDRQFTVDSYGTFKPACSVYHAVVKEMNAHASDCCMVASHIWDTIGAQSAGLMAAFIQRKGNTLLPVAQTPQPDYMARDILMLAKKLSK